MRSSISGILALILLLALTDAGAAITPLPLDHLPDFTSWQDCHTISLRAPIERHFTLSDPNIPDGRWYAITVSATAQDATPAFAAVVLVAPNPGRPPTLQLDLYSFDAAGSNVVGVGPTPLADTNGKQQAVWGSDSNFASRFRQWLATIRATADIPTYSLGTSRDNRIPTFTLAGLLIFYAPVRPHAGADVAWICT